MPHSKFNWRSTSSPPSQSPDGLFAFAFGDTWKLTDYTLVKPENAKGCTLDVSLEHDSKVTQLQVVCNASALQVSVMQAMNAQDFKWITQMRGTPLPNQPDLYYFRTPEELLTQKLWRLRVKFLFSSTDISAVRIQTLSLSFEKLTRRGSIIKGMVTSSSIRSSAGVARTGMTAVAASAGGMATSRSSHTTHPILYRGSSMSTTTSTTASLTNTPTGSHTPTSDSVCGDGDLVSDLSEEASTGSLGSGPKSNTSSASGSESREGRRTSKISDRGAIRALMSAIDKVISQGGNDGALVDELLLLKERLDNHLVQRSSEQHLNATIARISSIIQSIVM